MLADMFLLLSLLVACGTPDPDLQSVPAEVPAEEQPVEASAATGSIQGEPILPKAVVVGGIDNATVVDVVEKRRAVFDRCFQNELAKDPHLAGKVLVKFSIARDGQVTHPSVRSTSLRNEATEACLLAEIARVRFPALEGGKIAIVQYPFVFPAADMP